MEYLVFAKHSINYKVLSDTSSHLIPTTSLSEEAGITLCACRGGSEAKHLPVSSKASEALPPSNPALPCYNFHSFPLHSLFILRRNLSSSFSFFLSFFLI